MSRELRIVPPFDVPPALQSVFEGTVLHFGDRNCPAGRRIVVDSDDFRGRDVRIVWATDQTRFRRTIVKGLSEANLGPSDVALIVFVQTRYLRLTSEALRVPLDDLGTLDPISALDANLLVSARHRGARVRVLLVLTKDKTRRPLRPWRKGTCLARTEFSLDTDWFGQLFSPKALDARTRLELDLPASTMRYVRLGDHDPLLPYRDTEEPDFYVDEELLSRIHHWSGTPMAHMAQLQLVQDFVAAIVQRASSKLLPERALPPWQDVRNSLLGRMLTVAAGKKGDAAMLLAEVRDDPNKVLARFEHQIGLGKTYIDSVAEGSK